MQAARWRTVSLLVALQAIVGSMTFSGGAVVVTPAPTPKAVCGPGSHPETGIQGRISPQDYAGGYAAAGIRCNAEQVARFGEKGATGGAAGGFHVHRYVDEEGRECAYYDSTLTFPVNAQKATGPGVGVHVLDMTDPERPVKTANLVSPAMLSPHESLSLNAERGLLAAVAGFTVKPGMVDVYDLTKDCRYPVLKSSTSLGIVGHEGNFSPDGNTYWASSGGECWNPASLTAVDISDPVIPKVAWHSTEYRFHGLSVSDDGTRLYGTDLGQPQPPCIEATGASALGVRILDVAQVQARVPLPKVTEVSRLSWDTWSVPQVTIPVTIGGSPYLIEIDEFARGNRNGDPASPVGAARIIDISDERHPFVASDIRLEVHQPENIAAIAGDPGATFSLGGYTGHYCGVPKRQEPGIVACSFILSGLRVFDIRDARHPKEIAYFNAPMSPPSGIEATPYTPTAPYAMSEPAFVPERNEIWYTDGSHGFFNVRLTNNAWQQ